MPSKRFHELMLWYAYNWGPMEPKKKKKRGRSDEVFPEGLGIREQLIVTEHLIDAHDII